MLLGVVISDSFWYWTSWHWNSSYLRLRITKSCWIVIASRRLTVSTTVLIEVAWNPFLWITWMLILFVSSATMSVLCILLWAIITLISISVLAHWNILFNIVFVVIRFAYIHTWVSVHIEDVFLIFLVALRDMIAWTISIHQLFLLTSSFGNHIASSSQTQIPLSNIVAHRQRILRPCSRQWHTRIGYNLTILLLVYIICFNVGNACILRS